MAQVINQLGPFAKVGGGLAAGLEDFATRKLQQLQQQESRNELSSLLQQTGRYSKPEADLFARLPEKDLFNALQSYNPMPQQEQRSPIEVLRSQQGQPNRTILEQAPEENVQAPQQQPIDLSKLSANDLLQQATAANLGLPPEMLNQAAQKLTRLQQDPQKLARFQEELQQYANSQQNLQPSPIPQSLMHQPQSNALFRKPLSEADKIAARRADIAERKLAQSEASEARAETKKFRDQVNADRRSAKERLHDLERLDELENEKLETSGYYEFLKRSGYDIPALMNPQSQEYDKIATNFIRDAGNVYKGKVSNYEADLFLKLIPTLSLSPEGRNRVRSNMKRMERAKLAYANATDDIIRQNGGVPPFNLEERVSRRIDPILDKLSEQFRKDLQRPVPESQDPLVTAIQAGLGDAIGGISLKGAVRGGIAGAGLGSLAGGVGAVPGAVGGAIYGALGGKSKDLL